MLNLLQKKIILKRWWNNMKILISSRSFGKIDSGAKELLQKEGLDIIENPFGRKMTEKEMITLGKEATGIIAGTEKITKSVIEYMPHLKVISRYGIGLDNVEIERAQEKNILIYNTPLAPTKGVAELTMALLLNGIKKINILDARLKSGTWKPEIGFLLSNKKIGIIGLGNIGKQIVKYLKPFNVQILAYDIKEDKEFSKNNGIEYVSLQHLLRESDCITLHIPLTDKTKHMIGSKELNQMKETCFLINAARGGIIDEDQLYHALKRKKIAGAAIDAFEDEPDTKRLKELPNVILTPHIGTYTKETRKEMEQEAAQNIIKGLTKLELL